MLAVSAATIRILLRVAYDGAGFSGWARQPGLRTVEETLRAALGTVLRVPSPDLVVGGRTDAGVHARAAGNACHLDVAPEVWAAVPGRSQRTPEEALPVRLAGVLPREVVVRSARVVPEGFDARFSALRRSYRYRICDHPADLDPLRHGDTVVLRRPLDVASMDDAARRLEGLRDFAAFCRRREGATTTRTLLRHRWHREPDGTVVGEVEADAFCHSMVRALVGSMVPVGEGRREPAWPLQVADTGVRDPGVKVMPAHGLALHDVVYPPDTEVEARAREARARRG